LRVTLIALIHLVAHALRTVRPVGNVGSRLSQNASILNFCSHSCKQQVYRKPQTGQAMKYFPGQPGPNKITCGLKRAELRNDRT